MVKHGTLHLAHLSPQHNVWNVWTFQESTHQQGEVIDLEE